MPSFAIETKDLGRIYRIRGNKKEKKIRRSLIGDVAQVFPTLARLSNLELLGILVGLSVVFGVASVFTFRACDRRARERGLIDRVTNY